MKVTGYVSNINSTELGTTAVVRVGMLMGSGAEGEITIHGQPLVRDGILAVQDAAGQCYLLGDIVVVDISLGGQHG